MGRKKKYKVEPWEGTGLVTYGKKIVHDTSANIYESMLRSGAFRGLSNRQKVLYVLCKSQYFGKKKPRHDYPDNEELKSDTLFYMNWALVQGYGLYTKTMSRDFYRDMKALEGAGFIKKVVSGKPNHQKNIYEFSGDWRFKS